MDGDGEEIHDFFTVKCRRGFVIDGCEPYALRLCSNALVVCIVDDTELISPKKLKSIYESQTAKKKQERNRRKKKDKS